MPLSSESKPGSGRYAGHDAGDKPSYFCRLVGSKVNSLLPPPLILLGCRSIPDPTCSGQSLSKQLDLSGSNGDNNYNGLQIDQAPSQPGLESWRQLY